MSAAPAQAKPQKSKKEKEKEKERDKERKGSLQPQNERLKTVVRRLPANLPEEIFWQSVQQWVTNETAVWKTYCPGKLRKKLNKENVPSRAYIAFKEAEQLAVFSREYDGHVFRDKSGVESQAVVEFAPYPKIPSEKRKPDPRNGTIEKDEDYMSFLETLKAAENQGPVTLESLIASSQPAPPPKTTPLLEALKAEKSANKDKEAILRNHAHYNNMNVMALRKDEKKKVAASAAPPKADAKGAGSSAPAQASGKKAKKAQANADAATTSAQATKNAQQQGASAVNAKNVTANASASGTQPAKPAKPSRPPRGANKAAVAAAAAAAAANANGAAATNPPTILTANHVAPTSSAAANNNATVSAPAAAGGGGGGRRVRPVIGLASRQFEAALSGVSGLASAATERKRRERERDGGAGSGSGSNLNGINGASVPPTPTSAVTYARIDGSDNEKPTPSAKANPPASPKRERTRRGGRGGGGSGGPTTAAANLPQVKVPSILQRVAEPSQKNIAEGASNAVPAGGAVQQNGTPSGVGENASGAGGGRGGRRGRGGGRGRGGTAPVNASAPRGG